MKVQDMIRIRKENKDRFSGYNYYTIECIRSIEKFMEDRALKFWTETTMTIPIFQNTENPLTNYAHVKEYFQKEGYVTELLLLPHDVNHYILRLSWSEEEQNDKA